MSTKMIDMGYYTFMICYQTGIILQNARFILDNHVIKLSLS
jgi:hypothetical protein